MKTKQREYARRYRQRHPERARASAKKYYLSKGREKERQREKMKRRDPSYVEKKRAESRAFSPIYQKRKTAKMRVWREQLRRETFAAYGGACACCGESEPKFLTLDHIHNDGAKARREIASSSGRPRGGVWEYHKLRQAGFPQGRHRVLCWNCNCGRSKNGGVCPHEEQRQRKAA